MLNYSKVYFLENYIYSLYSNIKGLDNTIKELYKVLIL